MRKLTYFTFIIFLLSCKSNFHKLLMKNGMLDHKIELEEFHSNSKHIIIFPMIHVGTKQFYDDSKRKIDSLKKTGYYFYYEEIKAHAGDTLTLRKFKKIFKIPFQKDGFKSTIDTFFSKKAQSGLKEDLLNQPSYNELGLDSINSKNVDVNLTEIVSEYERINKVIVLEPCDYKTSVYEISICNDEKSMPRIGEDIIVHFRNDYILKTLQNEKHTKIAIIYGKGHFVGIKALLEAEGYIYLNYTLTKPTTKP